MRRFLSILTLAAFVVYVLNASLTWVVYGLFADQIAEELCVNPDNPCCHGKCYITGSIRTQEERKSLTPDVPLSPEKILLYIEPRELCASALADPKSFRLSTHDPLVQSGWTSLPDPPPRRLS